MPKQRKTASRKRKEVKPMEKKAHQIDVRVGKNIKAYRRVAKMRQDDLAKKVGVRFQQIAKYESALNRVSASRLWLIAEALEVNVQNLYR